MSKTSLASDQIRLGRLGVGALGLILSSGYFLEALRMPQGSADAPGPGVFPVGVGAAAIVISIVVVLEAVVSKTDSGSAELPKGKQRRDVLLFLGSLTIFILVLPILGQYVASALYMAIVLKILSTLSWLRCILFGFSIAIALSWIFMEVLSIRLPAGIW